MIFRAKCRIYKELLFCAKRVYYGGRFENCDNDKKLFRLVKSLTAAEVHVLPETQSNISLAEKFSHFFDTKIDTLRQDLISQTSTNVPTEMTCCSMNFTAFNQVTLENVHQLIKKVPSKSCASDPIPTFVLKCCLDTLLIPIVLIINTSFQTAVFPKLLKQSLIAPIIKNSSLDVNELSNYRPISNLPFLSKIIEKVAHAQFDLYLTANSLYPKMQSAYRSFHSTETALIKLFNDITCSLDAGEEVALVCLDLSSAFDTVDHGLLIQRLKVRFGLAGKVLAWVESYLSSREQLVNINGACSGSIAMKWGVPQGSVLGPLLFNLYISPVEDIITAHGTSGIIYADDTQIYISIQTPKREEFLNCLEDCINDVCSWFTANKLVCNSTKTNFIYFSSKFKPKPISTCIKFGSTILQPINKIRNLGVIWDSNLSMKHHVSKVCSSAASSLSRIGHIVEYLDKKSIEKLIHAFVTSKLDYCNSLFLGLPNKELNRLQRIQNCAARVITGTKKCDHITPVLESLHWLPIKARIQFKILLTTFKVIQGCCPVYLCDLIHSSRNTYNLRSSNANLLKQPRSRLRNYGDRSFSIAAPKLWNSLPDHIRNSTSLETFKKHLKTHLFTKNYL